MTRNTTFTHEDGSINMTNATAAAHGARREALVAGLMLIRRALRGFGGLVGLVPTTR